MKRSKEIEAALIFAKAYEEAHGCLPIIMDLSIYRFFGDDWVKIVEVNMYDTVQNAEVVIEDGWGERKEVQHKELMLWER